MREGLINGALHVASSVAEFIACMYYDAQAYYGAEEFPNKNVPTWILGTQYNPSQDMEQIKADMLSRIWVTYRKNFPPIGDTNYTTDQGWGCMLRCGQMVLAEALLRIHMGRGWRWHDQTKNDQDYLKIIALFEDDPEKPYSIHKLAIMGSESKPVGQWHGPNTAAHILRKLSDKDGSNGLSVHVAMNTSFIKDEIKEETMAEGSWKSLLLFIPLLLGVSEINSIYFTTLKSCLEMPQSIGILGGSPNHALYFVGYIENQLISLDPHVTQKCGTMSELRGEEAETLDQSYHSKVIHRIDLTKIDPSVALCFLCKSEIEFDDLCDRFQSIFKSGEQAMPFQIYETKPECMRERVGETENMISTISSSEEEEYECI